MNKHLKNLRDIIELLYTKDLETEWCGEELHIRPLTRERSAKEIHKIRLAALIEDIKDAEMRYVEKQDGSLLILPPK